MQQCEYPETQQKYAKASINGSLSPCLGRPLFLFDSNHERLEKEYGLWVLLHHPNVLPLFGLLAHPAIPSTVIMALRCTLGDLRVFFSNSARASVNRLVIVSVSLRARTSNLSATFFFFFFFRWKELRKPWITSMRKCGSWWVEDGKENICFHDWQERKKDLVLNRIMSWLWCHVWNQFQKDQKSKTPYLVHYNLCYFKWVT